MVLQQFQSMVSKPINFILRSVDETHEKIFWNINIILIFTLINWVIYNFVEDIPEDKKLSVGDAFYYTMTTHFTIGFGDIMPMGPWTRLIYYFHIVLVWFINMVPAGLTVFEELRKTQKEAFPRTRQLSKQSKFSGMTNLPTGVTKGSNKYKVTPQ